MSVYSDEESEVALPTPLHRSNYADDFVDGEDQPEFVANIPIRDPPPHAFRKVTGVDNYIDLTPTVSRPASAASFHQSSLSRPTPPPRSSSAQSSASSRPASAMSVSSSASRGLNVLMFLGSVRDGRICDRVAKFMLTAFNARNHHVTVIDPKDYNLGQVVQPIHFYKDPAQIPKQMVAINKQILEADAFVVVAAEYNSGISPALCSLMDNFPPSSYSHRPSAIVTYSTGQFGGIRAAMQLRQYLGDLLTVSVPNMIVIPKAHEHLSEVGVNNSPAGNNLKKDTDITLSQLEWYADAIKKQRALLGIPK
ncbi:hypothetical protein BV898_17994 [Hypsibius exemplaris]|uniref:POU-specific domain-containing protein n=1 Tax=Hypsibius exemplaris TaxID=2072580 RepID=A0A9X6RND2_HYPEX|nr:hypothetical protein BV898_17994 [Hypsibius exemplaris]